MVTDNRAAMHLLHFQSLIHSFLQGISLMTVPTHSMLAFSTSLPAQSPNGGKAVQTGGKLKLSRTTGEASVRHDDKLRRKSEIWRNDLVTAKQRKEDVILNFKGY